jgi:translation initiation factor 5A
MASRFDSDFEDELFECADSGAAETFPTPAADLKRGDMVCIRGRPCRVVDNAVTKNGKHGTTKANIEGEDIFTGRKYEYVCPGAFALPCPFVVKSEFTLVDIDASGALTLLDDNNEERTDLDLPLKDNEALARAIRSHFDAGKSLTVVAQKAMGVEAVMSFKFDTGR